MESLKEVLTKRYREARIPYIYDIETDMFRPVEQFDVELWQSFIQTVGPLLHKSSDPVLVAALAAWKAARSAPSSTTQGDQS